MRVSGIHYFSEARKYYLLSVENTFPFVIGFNFSFSLNWGTYLIRGKNSKNFHGNGK